MGVFSLAARGSVVRNSHAVGEDQEFYPVGGQADEGVVEVVHSEHHPVQPHRVRQRGGPLSGHSRSDAAILEARYSRREHRGRQLTDAYGD